VLQQCDPWQLLQQRDQKGDSRVWVRNVFFAYAMEKIRVLWVSIFKFLDNRKIKEEEPNDRKYFWNLMCF
jgi:hypothetical protein